ncbi:hypothetical protein D3C71_1752090 [compost metagenome]
MAEPLPVGESFRPLTINWIPWAKVTFAFGANKSLVTPLTIPSLCNALIFASAALPFISEKAKADVPKDTLAARIPHAIVSFLAFVWKDNFFIVPHLLYS